MTTSPSPAELADRIDPKSLPRTQHKKGGGFDYVYIPIEDAQAAADILRTLAVPTEAMRRAAEEIVKRFDICAPFENEVELVLTILARRAMQGDRYAEGVEAAAKVCDAEKDLRFNNSLLAKGGSLEWGDPESAYMAQGHKAITAQGLAFAIRALIPTPAAGGGGE